jgi:hypothetical protein
MHRGFENSVLRKIFGRKWKEVKGGRRNVHDEKHQGTYYLKRGYY